MKTIIEYLDDLKEKTGSDYKSAKLLKTNQSTISTLRHRNQCGDETAIKIADLLGVDRTEVLIAAAIARSEGDVKNAWEKASKRMGIAAGIAIAGALPFIYLISFNMQECILCQIIEVSELKKFKIGLLLALGMIFLTWSRNNGSTEKTKLLPCA